MRGRRVPLAPAGWRQGPYRFAALPSDERPSPGDVQAVIVAQELGVMRPPRDAFRRPLPVFRALDAPEELLLCVQVRAVPRPVLVLRQEERLLQHETHRIRFWPKVLPESRCATVA